MRRLHRSEWIDRLQGLATGAPVEARHPSVPMGARWRLRSAEFAPFEGVVEVVLVGDGGVVQVLIDQPLEIWADDDGGGRWVEIRSAEASLVVEGGGTAEQRRPAV